MVPQVSIGLPVRNGEATIATAIRSLLKQDFTDFELIISDNASTDDTEVICRSFDDPRIRYIRQPWNIGAAANFRFVLEQASGPYFMWGAHDDYWRPHCLSDNLAALEANPRLVGSVGSVCMGEHNFTARRLGNFPVSGSHIAKVRKILRNPGDNCRACGLFRTDALKASVISDDFVAWDWANMIRLTRFGDFHVIRRPHIIRGTDGDSRHPEYRGFLFLAPLNRWLWRELGPMGFVRCLPAIALQNLKFNRAWLTLSPIAKAIVGFFDAGWPAAIPTMQHKSPIEETPLPRRG